MVQRTPGFSASEDPVSRSCRGLKLTLLVEDLSGSASATRTCLAASRESFGVCLRPELHSLRVHLRRLEGVQRVAPWDRSLDCLVAQELRAHDSLRS